MIAAVSGPFDSLSAWDVRFLEEAARLGELHVRLWSDALVAAATGSPAAFPQAERRYLLEALRYVHTVEVTDQPGPTPGAGDLWVELADAARPTQESACCALGLAYRAILPTALAGFPPALAPDLSRRAGVKKVVVTGCYDWLHSGHVRFFEEAAAYGELYVVVGNDANVRNLKGEGHPLFPQKLRRYMVAAVRWVHQALITSGWGWLDAVPEIEALRPDVYLVNEDGDKLEKQAFCRELGLEYVVLKRLPRPGLQPRSSTNLRGF
jgi:cytidyltransferase-like protein